ncbi:hypothetical protein LXJ59_25315, partial [Escherichia coli]|nr:hypothetical protein [Escherichia coli]
RIASRPEALAREYALTGAAGADDILRAAGSIGLKARKVVARDGKRVAALPVPAIACLLDGSFAIFGGANAEGMCRVVNPVDFRSREVPVAELLQLTGGAFILVQRRFSGAGV